MVNKDGQTISATRFSELTGVSRERLRTWERRFGFPEPVRVAGGPRRYAVADAARVVAVRRAAADGMPLPVAIAEADAAARSGFVPSSEAFRAAVELAPVPVALVSGPQPLRLEWGNAALRAIEGAPAPGGGLGAVEDDPRVGAAVRRHLMAERPASELDHPAWGAARGGPADTGGPRARSVVYRLPVAPGQRPVVAVMGAGTEGEQEARAALAEAEAELARLRHSSARHDRWLDALGALAADFQHEPGSDIIGSALDVLIRQTRAVDIGLASYVSGRLVLHGTRRGALGACALTVAAHPQVGRALRDIEGAWLDATAAGVLGVPQDLNAAGLPIAVAGEVLGLLVMVFDEVEPLDADNRRLLAAISAAVGFALLRDRLVREVASVAGATPTERFAPPGAGATPTGG
jgi:hypothetical protein